MFKSRKKIFKSIHLSLQTKTFPMLIKEAYSYELSSMFKMRIPQQYNLVCLLLKIIFYQFCRC